MGRPHIPSTCACGSAITFALARCMRPRLLARLGDKHRRTFNTLDAALVADGVMIAILWRVAPIAPFVLSSALLSLTSISFGTYFWTTVVGCVPSTLPILLGADFAGREVAGDGERSWLSVGANVLSLVCAVVVVVKLGKIAVDVFRRHGFAQVDDEDEEGDEEEAEAETPTRVAWGESSPAVPTRARSPSWSESMGVPRADAPNVARRTQIREKVAPLCERRRVYSAWHYRRKIAFCALHPPPNSAALKFFFLRRAAGRCTSRPAHPATRRARAAAFPRGPASPPRAPSRRSSSASRRKRGLATVPLRECVTPTLPHAVEPKDNRQGPPPKTSSGRISRVPAPQGRRIVDQSSRPRGQQDRVNASSSWRTACSTRATSASCAPLGDAGAASRLAPAGAHGARPCCASGPFWRRCCRSSRVPGDWALRSHDSAPFLEAMGARGILGLRTTLREACPLPITRLTSSTAA